VVGAVGAAVWEEGAASVRRCHVSTLVVGTACLLVSVAGGGRCARFRVLARAPVLVLGGACLRLSTNANVSVVTLALVNAAAVVAVFFRRGRCGRRGGVEGAASVRRCHVSTLVVGTACLLQGLRWIKLS